MHLQSGFRTGTKFILWTLFVFQILLIAVFWILQQGFNIDSLSGENDYRVNFIRSSTAANNSRTNSFQGNSIEEQNGSSGFIIVESKRNFSQDFITLSSNSSSKICFRNGIVLQNRKYEGENINDAAMSEDNPPRQCNCQTEWHGKDCGQPEVIWRTLMTSKIPLKIMEAKRQPHKVVYMISGYFFSLDLLEIQIKEVASFVDFFIVFLKRQTYEVSALNKRLKQLLCERRNRSDINYYNHNMNENSCKNNFFLFTCNNEYSLKKNQTIRKPRNHTELVNFGNCTPKLAYKHFKAKVKRRPSTDSNESLPTLAKGLQSNDIFVYSHYGEILNEKALTFLKYYYHDSMGVMRFRLKYNVYGFFWQHPQSTYIGSVASSFRQLEDNSKSDPERLMHMRRSSLAIGDLNHFGGWYCKFCQQPSEIIEELQSISAKDTYTKKNSMPNELIFPKSYKNSLIDVNYVQKLIASGIFVDGKLGLQKLHRFSDKYYAPSYVEKNSWKYGNILINLYVSLDDDVENDEEYLN